MPAKASNPRMNETGPLAVPPLDSGSCDARSADRFEPAPDPRLNSMPSVLARSRIDDMVSSTALMKHAEHCGFSSMPTLNQTGLLKLAICAASMQVSSAWNVPASSGVRKYPSFRPHSAMVSLTRLMSWRTERSRSESPTRPRKYFAATRLTACSDHVAGASMFFWAKTARPSALSMRASWERHSKPSNALSPGPVSTRWKVRPVLPAGAGLRSLASDLLLLMVAVLWACCAWSS